MKKHSVFFASFVLLFVFMVDRNKPEVIPAEKSVTGHLKCPDDYQLFYDGHGEREDKSLYKYRLKK